MAELTVEGPDVTVLLAGSGEKPIIHTNYCC